MKLRVISIVLVLATCSAHGQRNGRSETEAVNRACTVEDCFLEAQIRDFEVIDRTHLIVYVGAQRCAFHVELRGALCDMSFAPGLYFRRTNEVPMTVGERSTDPLSSGDPVTSRVGTRSTDFDAFELERRERRDLRVCNNDLAVQVHGGRWTESEASSGLATDRFGNPRTDCRVSNVTSVTDDQLLEFYVGRGVVAPVPPMGTGEIEVGEQEEQGAAPPPPDAETPARGRRNAGEAD
jgi:hypothetical protein